METYCRLQKLSFTITKQTDHILQICNYVYEAKNPVFHHHMLFIFCAILNVIAGYHKALSKKDLNPNIIYFSYINNKREFSIDQNKVS